MSFRDQNEEKLGRGHAGKAASNLGEWWTVEGPAGLSVASASQGCMTDSSQPFFQDWFLLLSI